MDETPRQTPARETFAYNIEVVTSLMRLVDAQIDTLNREELPILREEIDRASDDVYAKGAVLVKYFTHRNTVEFQIRWYAVMLVTITEAYLQDALSFCAGLDPRLMNDSEQKATYAEIVAADSLHTLAEELRTRWARNFVDGGGPAFWIKRLTRMGVRGYPDALAAEMERLWGIRHLVVHQAGRVNPEFKRRHPDLSDAIGTTIQVNGTQIGSFALNVISFVNTTDRFLARRYLQTE